MDPTLSSNPLIQALVLLAGVLTTYFTLKYKDKLQDYLRQRQPKDRAEVLFDGYENFIKDLQEDLKAARDINRKQAQQLVRMQEDIDAVKTELKRVKRENRTMLEELRRYQKKTDSIVEEEA